MFYSSKERLFLGLLFFAALISLFFFINFRTLAFPEHNIKFDITREQAAEKAKGFVSDLMFDPENYKETTVFSIDDETKTYLEREVGVTETARLAASDVDVWHFTTRFFKPLEQEEISVAYQPNGRFVGYYHEIKEDAAGARLSKALAQERAEAFLATTVKTDVEDWKLVSGESVQRPNRTDHTFTWEKEEFKAKDATYRMEVYVLGDKIGGYLEFLKVPEAWTRAYEKETSNNALAQLVAETIMFLLFGLAIIITFILEYRRNNLRFASLRVIGVVTTIIAILTALNSAPLSLAGYPTTISWEAFIGSVVLFSILGGFFQGASVLFVIAAGEAKFRQVFPKMQSLESSIRQGLRTKEVNKALFVGVFAGIIFFAYELLYYFLGAKIGFWAPAETNYADVFSTVLPWLYPLFIGFMAAASEEGIFRLFGIPFLKKYLKSTWAAILITSVVWAFLHSNYPQSPWFVRGIEISVIGVVLGWLFVRYGFVASFTAHYTFNALQTAIYFFASGSLYASTSSVLVALLPFIIAVILLIIAWRKKGFVDVPKESLNKHLLVEKPETKKEPVAKKITAYQPLPRMRKRLLLGLSLASIVGLWFVYPQTSLEQVPTSLGRNEVTKAANDSLAKRGVSTEEYKQVTTFTPADISMEEEYILEKKDFATMRKIYPEKLPLAYWSVRYFVPLQQEEFIVDVLPDGRIYQIVHVLDEKALGANLSADEARKIAESYLAKEKGFKKERFNLVESKADKKDKRTDHMFGYEEKGTAIGEATFRIEVLIKGAEVSGFEQSLKLPEAWLREKSETSTLDFVIGGLVGIFAVILLSFGFRTFLHLLRTKQLRFRSVAKFAATVTVLSLIGTINGLSTFYDGYNTAIPLLTFTIESVLMILFGAVLSFFFFMVIFAMFLALWKQYAGQIIPDKAQERVHYIKDALIAGYSVPIILAGISSGLTYLYLLLTDDLLSSGMTFDTFPQLDSYVPFVSIITELPLAAAGISLAAIAALILKKYFGSWKRVLITLGFVAILIALPQQRTWEDTITATFQNLLLLAGGVLVVKYIFKNNLLAYFCMLYSSLILTSGWVLFLQPNIFFKINGIILLLFALLPLSVFLYTRGLKLFNLRG